MKAIQKTWEQMLGDDALKEQIEWMKKATFPDTDPEEAIERIQEINDNLEFFESGASKLSERELIKEVIAKNLRGEIKAEFIRNKGHKCVDLNCKRYVKVNTEVNVARNEAKRKRDQQNDKKKLKSSNKNICRKHKTHKWSECPDNKNSPNYIGNKGEKKRLEGKSIKNKNKGEKTSGKAKK